MCLCSGFGLRPKLFHQVNTNTATRLGPIAVTCLTTPARVSYIEAGKFSAEMATLQRYTPL
jgi:hypothetical protein